MKKKWKGWLAGPLAAFVLAAGVVAATPAMDGKAQAVDIGKACTLTVAPGGADFSEDLAKAHVVVDLYKVADAIPDSDGDTYSYGFAAGYTELKVSDKPDNAQWQRLAQQAARIALNGGTPDVSGDAGSALSIPGCGLYLVVARGADITDYIKEVTGADGEKELVTIARSGEYTYTFAPSLVSLPSKEAVDGEINTANPGDWLYDVSVTLKPERDVRYGDLEIVKTLQSYETDDPAKFVFQVEAVLNGQNVYSNVVTISFTEAGQKSVVIEDLPVGAEVTVKEVYTGAVYTVVTADTQTAVIPANDVVSVAFTNGYDNTDRDGGVVINQFDYNADSGWGWTKVTDGE